MILRALATLAPARYRLEFSNAFASTHNTNSYFRKEMEKKRFPRSFVTSISPSSLEITTIYILSLKRTIHSFAILFLRVTDKSDRFSIRTGSFRDQYTKSLIISTEFESIRLRCI